jgi:phage gp46-like protein
MNSGRDQRLDPLTGAYDGTTTTELDNAVYIRITTPLGSYWADPGLGSRLHELQRELDLKSVEVKARKFIKDALQPLLDDKRADSIEIETEWPQTGCLFTRTSVYQNGELATVFTHPVQIA